MSGWLIALGVSLGAAQDPEPVPEPAASSTRVEDAPATPGVSAAPRERLAPEPATEDTPPVTTPPTFNEPLRIRGRDQLPTKEVRDRYTARPPLVRPAFRVAPGFSGRITGRPIAAFRLDVLASVLVGLHSGRRQFGLAPELGYSLRAPRAEHDLLGGVGLVYGVNAESWTVGLLPRFVAQPGPDGVGFGVRNGLWWDFAENGFSFELSHQWVRRVGGNAHDLQLSVGLDVAMLVFALTGAEMAWL